MFINMHNYYLNILINMLGLLSNEKYTILSVLLESYFLLKKTHFEKIEIHGF